MSEDQLDLDAELDRELAALEQAPLHPLELAQPSTAWNDTDEELDRADTEEDELPSFLALQGALQERDRKCEQFLQEIQAVSTLQGSATQAQPVVDSHSSVQQVLGHSSQAPEADSSTETGNGATHAISVQQAVAALQHIVSSRPSTAQPRKSEQEGIQDDPAWRLEQALQERQCVLHEHQTSQREDLQSRQHKKQQELEREEAQRQATQVAAEEAAKRLAAEHAASLQALEQARAVAELQLQQEQAKEAAELQAMKQAQLELEQRLQEQVAARQAHEAAMEQMQQEAALQVAQELWRHTALNRIARAWKRWRASPARQHRVLCITLLQAAWKGRQARLQYAISRDQKRALVQLQQAAALGSAGGPGLDQAMHQAMAAGVAEQDIWACISSTQQQTQEVIDNLQAQAGQGSAVAFRQAVQQAERFPQLAAFISAASQKFEGRREAALQAVRAAATDQPMQELTRALDAAAQLGVESTQLSAALDQARQRDAQLRTQLMEMAVQPDFDEPDFNAVSSQAATLGLQGDVAAARAQVNRRRRQIASQMALTSFGEIDYETAQGWIAVARRLGMQHEAQPLSDHQEKRRAATQAALMQAASAGSPDQLQDVLVHATTHGVALDIQQQAQALLTSRQVQAAAALQQAAHTSNLNAYKRARRTAILCGALDCLAAAEDALSQRQQCVAEQLSASVHHLHQQLVGQPDVAISIAAALHVAIECQATSTQGQLHAARGSDAVLPVQVPAPVLEAAGHKASEGFRQGLDALWRSLVEAMQLGMLTNVQLAVGALHLLHSVEQAQGARVASQLCTRLSYSGSPQVPGWPDSDQFPTSHPGASQTDTVSASACIAPGAAAAWLWPPSVSDSDVIQLLAGSLTPSHSIRAATTLPAVSARPRVLPPQDSASKSQPLSQATVASVLGPAVSLAQAVKLDLGLENLNSISGLDGWCPGLQQLLLAGNQLGSLEGVEQLGQLVELNARNNRLTDLAQLGSGRHQLRKLHVDCNQLSQLHEVAHLSQLHTLTAADNAISHLLTHNPGSSLASSVFHASSSTLTVLDLSRNQLTSLAGLSVCTALVTLDVSNNQLTSLDGLHACHLLQTLLASRNQIQDWPQDALSALHHLTHVDLSTNHIRTLRPASAQLVLPPSLRELLLHDNQITELGLMVGPYLRKLDLSFNGVTDCDQIRQLAPLTALTHLQVNDNPVASHPSYARTVHACLPYLNELDHQPITPTPKLTHVAKAALRSPAVVLGVLHKAGTSPHMDLSPAVHAAALAAQPTAQAVPAVGCAQHIQALGHLVMHADMPGQDKLTGARGAACQALWHVLGMHSHELQTAQRHLVQARHRDLPGGREVLASQVVPVHGIGAVLQQESDMSDQGVQSATQPIIVELKRLAGQVVQGIQGDSRDAYGAGTQHEAVVWGEYEQQVDQAVHRLRVQHAQQASNTLQACARVCAGGSGGDSVWLPDVLVYHPLFEARRMQAMTDAATRIQSAWRARIARDQLQALRSQQHLDACQAAAVVLQSSWRARVVRVSPELRAMRMAAAAQQEAQQMLEEQARMAAAAAELADRTSAAVCLQSAIRGWLVRQWLKQMMSAARYQDDLSFDGDDDLLADIESILHKEHIPVTRPTLPAVPTLNQPKILDFAAAASVMASVPALAKAFAAKGGAAGVKGSLAPVKAAWGALDPSVPAPGSNPEYQLAPLQHSPGAHKDISMAQDVQKTSLSKHPPPVLVADDGQSMYSTDGPLSPSNQSIHSMSQQDYQASTAESKQQRHIERMRALMVEWGFQDIATAEAFWRRQQRATQGTQRQKMEAKFKDPALRLRKLQEKVEHRAKLRPEDVQRPAAHGPEMVLNRGALQGPPSREAASRLIVHDLPRHSHASGQGGAALAKEGSVISVSSDAQQAKGLQVRGGRHVSSAEAAVPGNASAGQVDVHAAVTAWQRSTSFPDGEAGAGMEGHVLVGRHSHPVKGASGSPAGQLPSVARPPRHDAGVEDDRQSVHSLASAASEPQARRVRGDSGGVRMPPLHKSMSLAGSIGGSPGSAEKGKGSTPAQGKPALPLVLPQVAPMSNNWVLDKPSGGGGGGKLDSNHQPDLGLLGGLLHTSSALKGATGR